MEEQLQLFESDNDIEEKSLMLDAFGLSTMLLFAGRSVPAWWTPERDKWLREFVIGNQFMGNNVNTLVYLINSIDFIVVPKNSGVADHNKQAKLFNELLLDFLGSEQFEQFLLDMLITDNGGFLYIEAIESSNKPINTFPLGLRHLDSTKVQRTGDSLYPYIYWSSDGNGYKMHKSRIINLTQMPMPFEETYGIGLSFVSRALLYSRHLLDVTTYEDELLGNRGTSEIIMLSGANGQALRKAIRDADVDNDNAGFTRYGNRVYLGIREANAKLSRVLLKDLPQGYDKRDDFGVILALIAQAAGVANEHFSLSNTGGNTKASAALAENFSNSKLQKWFIDKLTRQINNKFLPNSLKVVDVQSAARLNSEKSKVLRDLAFSTRIRLEHGVTDARVERQSLLDQGVLSREQFEELELKEGRLPNGMPLLDIFYSTSPEYQKYFAALPNNPLDVENKVEADLEKLVEAKQLAASIALNSVSSSIQSNAKIMYYAITELEKLYMVEFNGVEEVDEVEEVEDTALTQIEFEDEEDEEAEEAEEIEENT